MVDDSFDFFLSSFFLNWLGPTIVVLLVLSFLFRLFAF